MLLSPRDLVSKWGFGDGDVCDELLDDLVDASPWATRVPARDSEHRYEDPLWQYLSSRALLVELVRTHLLPVLPEQYRSNVNRVPTVHNPVRLSVDETEEDTAENMLATTAPVAVTDDQLRDAFERRFPVRPEGWVALFDVLRQPFSALGEDAKTHVAETEHGLVPEPHLYLCRFLDAYATQYHDDELLLAAHLLNSSDLTVSSVALSVKPTVEAVLHSASLVLRERGARREGNQRGPARTNVKATPGQ